MTLALLITAASGAWAGWTGGTYTATTNEELGAIIVGADATLTINEGVTVTVSGGINAIGTLTVKGAGMLTVTGANGADGANSAEYDGGGGGSGSAGFTGILIVDGATVNVTGGNGGNGGSGLQYGGNGGSGAEGVSGSITLNIGSVTVTGGAGGNGGHGGFRDGSGGRTGQAVTETITAWTAEESDDNSTWTAIPGTTSSKRYVRAESTAPAVEVIINDTKTEASFEMPTFDVTVKYELVRDMSVSMPVTVGTGNDGYRIRIKKDEQTGKFVPAEMTPQAMAGLIAVTDDIEKKTLTNVTDYTVSIFAIGDNGEPTGDAIAFQDLVPGRYVAKATAATGSAYDGTTALSNIFELYQGYEVTIPAGEYITYYRDEPLKLDDADKESIELYTVSSVTATEAVLSDPFDAAPANTPLLVYNKNTEEAKTILLIPCNEPDLALTVADAFKGTLDAKVFSKDDMEAANYYVCTGKAFAPVKSAGTIAANRCWLEISTAAPSNARKIVHGDATKITNTDRTDLTDGDLYDLNGRKVLTPTKKGIYIKNGKKVVIK